LLYSEAALCGTGGLFVISMPD